MVLSVDGQYPTMTSTLCQSVTKLFTLVRGNNSRNSKHHDDLFIVISSYYHPKYYYTYFYLEYCSSYSRSKFIFRWNSKNLLSEVVTNGKDIFTALS